MSLHSSSAQSLKTLTTMPQTITDKITEQVCHYLNNEQQYTDNIQLRINPQTFEVDLADAEDDLPTFDYVPIMELIKMSSTTPGQWEPDTEAINLLAADYIITQ